MSQEIENLRKEAFDLGVQSLLLKDHKTAFNYFVAAIEMGYTPAKLLIFNFIEPSYQHSLSKDQKKIIGLTDSEIDIIKKRGNATAATPEDQRNLGLYYLFERHYASDEYIIKAANQNDSIALECIAMGYVYHSEIMKHNGESLEISTKEKEYKRKEYEYDYFVKASQAGSLVATQLLQDEHQGYPQSGTLDRLKYSVKEAALKASVSFHKLKAEFIIPQLKTKYEEAKKGLEQAPLTEFAVCSSELPTEVIHMILPMMSHVNKHLDNYLNYSSQPNLPASADNFYASTASTPTSNPMNTTQFGALMNQAPPVPKTPLPTPDAADHKEDDTQEKGNKLRVGMLS